MDISFLIPVYNASRFIEECVRSVVAQGLDFYEILTMDDCSADDSYEKLLSLSRTYPQMQAFRNAVNGGVAYTRNRLLEKASGRYVWFLDSDDMVAPGAAAHLLDIARAHDADYVSGNFAYVSEEDRFDAHDRPDLTRVTVECFGEIGAASPHEAETNAGFGISCGALIRRAFFSEHRLAFRENLRWHEDATFVFEASVYACTACHSDAISFYYRVNPTSLTHARSNTQSKAYYINMRNYERIIREYEDSPLLTDAKKEQVRTKLYQLKESLAFTLCLVPDKAFAKAELTQLKQDGLFPYQGRKETLHNPKMSFPKRLAMYLMHRELAWKALHGIVCMRQRNR